MREKALREFFAAEIEGGLKDISEAIAKNIEKNEAAIKDEAVGAFSALCDKAKLMRNKGELGDVESIAFSFLRVGLADEKAFYRIDACDEDWLLQKNHCLVLWEAKAAFEPYFELARTWKRKARSFGRNLREVDTESYILEYSRIPMNLANAFLAKTAKELGEHHSYASLPKTENCAITVGEYRAEQMIIFPEEEETTE
jgi:hypothetical protein